MLVTSNKKKKYYGSKIFSSKAIKDLMSFHLPSFVVCLYKNQTFSSLLFSPCPLFLIPSFKPKFHSIKFIQIFVHKKLICQGKEPF